MIYVGLVMAVVFLYGVVRFYDSMIRMMDKKIKDIENKL